MTVKQLSIFLENKNGTLIKVLDTLSKANIQIIASTVADTKDYGIYRVLCNNPVQAYMLLKDEGINVQLTDVFAISIDDTNVLPDLALPVIATSSRRGKHGLPNNRNRKSIFGSCLSGVMRYFSSFSISGLICASSP